MEKICTSCNVKKDISFFDKQKNGKFGVRSKCKDCRRKVRKVEYDLKYKEYFKERYNQNIEKEKEYRRNHYLNNKERYKEYSKSNKSKIAERVKKRRRDNEIIRLSGNYRHRTYQAFKSFGFSKNSKTMTMLGCDWDYLKSYIENKFIGDMNWDNYGEWHIDHIKPLCSAGNKEDLIKLCHYTNLQPLWAKDNLSKGGKY